MLENPFQEPRATALMTCRMMERKRHKIVYDCLNAVVNPTDPTRVICRLGYEMKWPGRHQRPGVPLESVLGGGTCKQCKKCDARSEETDE